MSTSEPQTQAISQPSSSQPSLSNPPLSKQWYVYLVRVAEGNALYCGVTNNLEKRLNQHKNGTGAKWCRGKTVMAMVWTQACANRSEAQKLEHRVKKLSKARKEKLISEQSTLPPVINEC